MFFTYRRGREEEKSKQLNLNHVSSIKIARGTQKKQQIANVFHIFSLSCHFQPHSRLLLVLKFCGCDDMTEARWKILSNYYNLPHVTAQ